MKKKKYMKSTPNLCKEIVCKKRRFCMCEISGHRKWMSVKYYGHDDCSLSGIENL